MSLEPVPPNRELYGVDARIWCSQAGVGDVLVARAKGERALLFHEELKAQRGMSEKVDGRGVARNLCAREQYAAAEFEIGYGLRRVGEVPLQVHGIEACAVSVLGRGRLPYVVHRHYVRRPLKVATHKAAAVVAGKDLAQTRSAVEHVRV